MLKLQSIWKYFPKQDRAHAALKDISIDISKGSSVAIVERSGSGKSTLIHYRNRQHQRIYKLPVCLMK